MYQSFIQAMEMFISVGPFGPVRSAPQKFRTPDATGKGPQSNEDRQRGHQL